MKKYKSYIYFLTNKNKTTLYLGVTSNLKKRLSEHQNGIKSGFAKQYNCHYLVYYEQFNSILDAIAREKEIKKWRRAKKNKLINGSNPKWKFLQPWGPRRSNCKVHIFNIVELIPNYVFSPISGKQTDSSQISEWRTVQSPPFTCEQQLSGFVHIEPIEHPLKEIQNYLLFSVLQCFKNMAHGLIHH